MKTKINEIKLTIPGGMCEGEACKEAIQFSMEHVCNVSFFFNGKEYIYLFNELIASCAINKN